MRAKADTIKKGRVVFPNAKSAGFIKTILLIVIGLIVLGFFGYNLRAIINSPVVHDNLSYVWELVVTFWNNFLQAPILWVWEKISGLLSK